MIVKIKTADHKTIMGMVGSSTDVVRILQALAMEGKTCIWWRLENVDC